MRAAFSTVLLVLAATVAFGAPAAKNTSGKFDCSIVKSAADDNSFKGVAPEGKTGFLKVYGFGTQNYMCTKGAFALVEPKADLYLDKAMKTKVGTHGFEDGNPFWESGGGECGKIVTKVVADSKIPAPLAEKDIPWFRTDKISTSGGDPISSATNVIRAQTHGGVAPKGACKEGAKISVDYSTTYVFYK